MIGERWEQVVGLFERALERPAEEREAFVAEASGSDDGLRDEVLAMLRADAAPHPFLDATGTTGAGGPAAEPVLAGRRIGPYTVIREIGRGAMATVCLARDPRHRREVALKLIHDEARSALGGERFRREIVVVAGLQHPHIVPLYDSGESDGRLYYVMPVMRGESLRQRIAREGRLPLDAVRRITAEVGSALDYAHRRGVIHRDVTPGNILLDAEHAAIADFGIARRVVHESGEEITAAGMIIGTPAYMSPEQALGETEPDARTDVYALACVVFAMLTGEPPFRGASAAAVLAQHLRAPPPSARAARPELAPAVDAVLARAMAKDPADRYGSVRELVDALDAALASPAAAAGRRVRWSLVAGVAGVLAVAALAARLATRPAAERPAIVVLPFANLSGDPADEYFSDGMTDEVTAALAQLGRIRVTPRTTAFAYKGVTGDLRRLREELGVSRVLEGSVRRDAGRVLVRASLYDAATGDQLWSNRYERSWGSILALQSELAGAIAEQLLPTLLPGERARLRDRYPVNPDAYDSYLRGRHFFNIRTNASLQQAVVHFQRALAIDSMFARAHAGLADSYSILAWTGSEAPHELFRLAAGAARRALELDSLQAEVHVSLGIIHTFHHWNWEAAGRATSRALALDSTLATAWFFRTWHLVAVGRMDEALDAISRARRLEPLSLINNARLATVLAWRGDLEAADSVLVRTIEIDPAYPVARVQRARVLSLLGRHREAVAALPPDSIRLGSFEAGIPGFVYARAGRPEAALASVRALEARASPPGDGIAAVYVGLGDTAAALSWLERAVDDRATSMVFVAAEPMYAPLRSHPRFQRVLERIGLRPPGAPLPAPLPGGRS